MDKTVKTYISLGSLITLLFFLPLFSGGKEIYAFLLAIILIVPIIFFAKDDLPSLKNRFVAAFGLFIVAAIVSTLMSPNFYASFSALLWWILYFLIFMSSVAAFSSKSFIGIFAKSEIAIALLFSIVGIWTFLNDTSTYLRMRPIFGQHNAFAAFLIIPVLISIGYIFKNYGKRRKMIIWSALASFLIGIFILTFSRGGFIALAIPLLIGIVVLYLNNDKKKVVKFTGILGVVLVVGALISLALFSIHNARKQADTNEPLIIYQNETAEANGVSLRLRYWKDALHIISQNPLLGVGLGNYNEGIRVFRTIDGVYTADPHNLYLRLYAETGAGSLFILIFFALILWAISKKLGSTADPIELMIALGVFGLLLHSAVDADWIYPANAILFFSAAGILVARNDEDTAKWWGNFLVVVSITVFVAGFLIFKSVNHLEDGKFFAQRGEKDSAEEEFKAALALNYFKNSEIPYELGMITGKAALLDKALEYAPRYSAGYLGKAGLPGVATSTREELLSKAIEYNRGSSYTPTIILAELYMKEGKYDEAKKLIEENLAWFEKYAASDVFKSDPNRADIKESVERLKKDLESMSKGK